LIERSREEALLNALHERESLSHDSILLHDAIRKDDAISGEQDELEMRDQKRGARHNPAMAKSTGSSAEERALIKNVQHEIDRDDGGRGFRNG